MRHDKDKEDVALLPRPLEQLAMQTASECDQQDTLEDPSVLGD